MPSKEIDRVLTTDEAIEYLKLSRPTYLKYIRTGRIRAIKAPQGGTIEMAVDLAPENGGLGLSVQDNGDGLAKEYHQKIFDKFEQVKLKSEKGRVGSTGLGLTFCKMAIEAHGGRIWVESEGEGRGCTFRSLLPLSL